MGDGSPAHTVDNSICYHTERNSVFKCQSLGRNYTGVSEGSQQVINYYTMVKRVHMVRASSADCRYWRQKGWSAPPRRGADLYSFPMV